MKDWFTIEQIDADTYVISEYGHWEETHCYLILGNKRALLLDTGLGVANIRQAVDSLTDLPILAAATHVHWDHIGGHKYFDTIAVHPSEASWLSESFPIPLSAVKHNLLREPCAFPSEFDPDSYAVFQGHPSLFFNDGDRLELGGRTLLVIHTPGHSPGHLCFYDTENQYLFTGDLIYQGCLYAYYPTTDPVAFFDSVKKVKNMKVNRLLPGHHRLDLSSELTERIYEGFWQIEQQGRLKQGSGIFDFRDFSIQI